MGILWDMYRSGISSEDSRKMLCSISKAGIEFMEKSGLSGDSILGVSVSATSNKYGIPSGDWLFSVRFLHGDREHTRGVCYSSVKGLYAGEGTKDHYTDVLLGMHGTIYNLIRMVSTYRVQLYAVVIKIRNCRSNIGIVTLRNQRVGIVYEGTGLPENGEKYPIKSIDLTDLCEYDCKLVVSL